MASEEGATQNNSYWQTTRIVFADGMEINVTLDKPTLDRVQAGDNQLLETIRTNYFSSLEKSNKTDDDGQEGDSSEARKSISSGSKVSESLNIEETRSDPTGGKDTSAQSTHSFWPDEAVKLLINLYQEHQNVMENPLIKKKDAWELITKKMNESGFMFSQSKVECKWRNLLQSHKEIRDNKKTTGQRRKSFQFYSYIEDIVAKRHDINPPCTSGSSVIKPQKKKFKMHIDTSVDSKHCEGSNSVSQESNNPSDSSDIAGASDNSFLSTPSSSKNKGRKRKRPRDDDNDKVIDFLKKMEATRQKNYEEGEKRKDARSRERNEILKDFLKALKD